MRVCLKKQRSCQQGFGLIEILVGLAIGLIVTLVVTQVMVVYEGQKRGTSGSAGAQTSGSISLYMIQRQVQLAGYGMPIYGTDSPLMCDNSNDSFDPDGSGPRASIGIPPIVIADGGTDAGASDTITVRFGTQQMGGFPVQIVNATAAPTLQLVNNLGCQTGDVAVVINGSSCQLTTVTDVPAATVSQTRVTLDSVAGAANGAWVACVGDWQENVYRVNGDTLEENGVAVMSNIVNMQAQYGISASVDSAIISEWVDAVDGAGTEGKNWVAPSVTDRNRIKAVRIALVARNDLLEKDNVVNAPCKTGVCTWTGNDPASAGKNASVNITNLDSWQRYRYRVFQTVVPIRNVIWSSGGSLQ